MNVSEKVRLFVAIDAPAPVRAALDSLPQKMRDVVWTPPHQYHITLRFIGDVESAQVAAIEHGLSSIRVESFVLPVAGVGSFPPGRPARVIWAGTGEGHPRLHQLRQKVDDALIASGLADLDVRTFHPHFTLARCGKASSPASAAGFLKRHRDFEGPSFRVDTFTLYRSDTQESGAVHVPLLRVHLSGPA
jgi:RNA 2',3'-cyclic 3'-phosphodiesterase